MRALVTGATGFIGSHLVEALRARGDEVTALLRTPSKAGLLTDLTVRLVHGDLHTPEALRQAVAGQDVIFHVAGLVAARDEIEFLHANRDGTTNLVQAAEQAVPQPRFVLVSSMAAGGPAERGHPHRGDELPRPVTQYGRSKLAGEEVVRRSRLRWAILRPPMVYGPRDTEVLKVFRLARSGIVPVFGDGGQELSASYAPDLAQALIAAGSGSTTEGRTYYPCHPEILTSADFVRAVGRAVGRSVRIVSIPQAIARGILAVTGAVGRIAGRATLLTVDKANEFFQPAWTGDPAPLARDTGWTASRDLEAGLAETVTWYRSQGWL